MVVTYIIVVVAEWVISMKRARKGLCFFWLNFLDVGMCVKYFIIKGSISLLLFEILLIFIGLGIGIVLF